MYVQRRLCAHNQNMDCFWIQKITWQKISITANKLSALLDYDTILQINNVFQMKKIMNTMELSLNEIVSETILEQH